MARPPRPTCPPPRTAVLAALLSLAAACGSEAPPFERALARARAEARPLLVHFAARELPAGERLARTAFDDARRRRALDRRAVVLELDARAEPELFRAAFGESGRLGAAFFAPDGAPLTALPGAPGAAEVELWCERVAARLERWTASRDDPLARAEVCLELHAWRGAAAALERALAASEDLSPAARRVARAHRARAWIRLGRVAAARDELDAIEAEHGPDDATRLTRALVHLAERDAGAALACLDRVERRAPREEELLLAEAIALHAAERADGLEPLGVLLERYPRSPWRAAALRQLEHVLVPDPGHTH